MKRSSGSRKTTSNLSESTHQQLNMYALAASAAGVSLLALTQPADAKIVYTKAHEVLGLYGLHTYSLDPNHDGIGDFTFTWVREFPDEGVDVGAAAKNGVLGRSYYPIPLNAGTPIGPKGNFIRGGALLDMRGAVYTSSYTSLNSGYWLNVKNRYLGLKFLIKGRVHYGWARLSVIGQFSGVTAFLSGYAYETIPNKAIVAGRTRGANDAEPPAPVYRTIPAGKPATLGSLALGAPGLSIWKRAETK